jgi:hypothetical protein
MKRIALSLAFSGSFLVCLACSLDGPMLMAQGTEAAATSVACPPTTTLDELIKAIDAGVSGPASKDRACMRELLLPEARLAPMMKAPDGSFVPHILTLDEWAEGIRKRGNAILYEHQVKVSSEVYGHVAHLWSTYELRLDKPDGPPTVRGINSIQAAYDGKRWRILEILWQAETPDLPVPAKYLP